nr:MAG TPA: hypothetical protein [Caudoviricetes sp.]
MLIFCPTSRRSIRLNGLQKATRGKQMFAR